MTSTILAFLKFLFSKDFRAAIAAFLKYGRASTSWNQDFITQKAKIKKTDRELANAYCAALCAIMKEKNFAVATIVDFQTAFAELALNAFTYGCSSDRDYVQFRAVIFGSGISFEIANRKTLIAANIDEIKQKTRFNRGVTGRGLPLVYSLADQFEFISNGRGIKIVMFDHDRSHALCEENGIRLVTVGNYLGDFIEKIRSALAEVRGDVIVIFSEKDKDEDKAHRGHMALSIAMRSLDEVEQIESVDDLPWSWIRLRRVTFPTSVDISRNSRAATLQSTWQSRQ
jgi:anti-sigma regulatory factor (Ser/Thr protein kinase)